MNDAGYLPAKPRFYDLCKMYQFDAMRLQDIENQAGVSKSVVNSLFLGDPVKRSDAEKVLAVVSDITGRTWNLDNTNVPLTSHFEGNYDL